MGLLLSDWIAVAGARPMDRQPKWQRSDIGDMRKQKIRMGAKRYALGASGLRVSRPGRGRRKPHHGWRRTGGDDDRCGRRWDAGLRHYDTAPLITRTARPGTAGGSSLAETVATSSCQPKLDATLAPAGERRFDFSGPAIEQSIEVSVKRLGLHQLDMVSVHDLDDGDGGGGGFRRRGGRCWRAASSGCGR